ncbi:hypothetical protein D8674_035632 [Pyrus ussuriensis x Pyrus communis]|uniref:Uncharacterized protein n=1 Tax=Pyrus ussuriensis x Pyrus communis TaxID=2448454 RepID=A0A5N5GCY1_9ROSA|nr:hypothetical protein D8674_035632 [Pyrus ussuriensis x Pyrus communis]
MGKKKLSSSHPKSTTMNSSRALRPRALEARLCKWLPLLPQFENSESVNPRLHLWNPAPFDSVTAYDPPLQIATTPFRGVVFLDYSASLNCA